MNIAQLKLSQKKLLDNLVSRGYDIQYIKGVKFVLRLLFEHEGCFHSYEQFAEKFIRTRGYTKATLDLRMMHLRTTTRTRSPLFRYAILPGIICLTPVFRKL